jgi:sugar O-acyltransferase (sialic acid O-acetyltransferase NeuD family)
MPRLVIYGAGGFGREVVTAARGCGRELAFLSDTPAPPFAGIPSISLAELTPDDEVVIAVADARMRRKLAERCSRFGKVIAPTAVIGHEVEIGEGSILCDFTMVTASARIGRQFHGNIYSYVAHDCVIGDFVTFAPKVCCNGNVHIGDGAYIGTGAMIRQGSHHKPLVIGEGAVIGMGAVVTKDVAPGTTVVGNPARPMQPKPDLVVAGSR